jgi:replicative DNA helicase
MGKSALALNIATNAARSGRKVLYLCLEDTREQLVLRLLARLAGQNLHALSLGRINADGFTDVLGASALLEGMPLWTDDTPGKTSAQWVRVVRRHYATEGVDLVIIDHLGEVADKGENETAITSHAAITFREMAKELDVPVVLLSQLNRAVEQRPNKRPMRSDLRQSGVIEQIARFILFPFRGGYYSGEHARRDMELIVAKATNFPIATFRCFADLAHMYVRGWEVPDGAWTGDEAAGTDLRNVQTADDDTF